MRRREFLGGLFATGVASLTGVPAVGADSPPGDGRYATWTTGEQYGVGTVADHRDEDSSRVWFTLTEGSLAGLRFPRVDLLDVRTVEFVVAADGYAARTHNETRLDDDAETLERSVSHSADDALLFEHRVTETAANRDWTLTAEYVAHPDYDAVLADVSFDARDGRAYDVYVVADPSLSNSGLADEARRRGQTGESGGGRGQGQDEGYVLTAWDDGSNDGEAVIRDPDGDPYNVAMGLASDRGFDWASVDVVGGDVLSSLFDGESPGDAYDSASGNVALVGRLATDARSIRDTVAVGFATEGDADAAAETAARAFDPGYGKARAGYRQSWRSYLAALEVPDAVGEGDLRTQYDVAAMTLKAADSKQFPGAGIASPSVPWGDATIANTPADYGYNYVWARDLYQAYTAMEAMGDVESARDAVSYIYEYQQRDDGFVPQNTFLDGRTRWGGEQMDEISFPQVMTHQLMARHDLSFDDVDFGYDNVRRSADYVVSRGPSTAQERWEEEGGLSPSTTAAEIAGLACAATIADGEGRRADGLAYVAVADHWQAHTEEWMATTTGTEAHQNTPYYFRINDDRDPDDGATLDINNGGPKLDERNVVDQSFLELVRLGVKSWDDEVVRNSLSEVDDTIRVETPHGTAFYRYNGDGYGEQGDDDSDRLPEGAPWGAEVTPGGDRLDDPDMSGQGRLWPIFTGERAEYELLVDDGDEDPAAMLETMAEFANEGRMIPEQVWDRPDPTEFEWEFGEGTGSATPLSWSMAQFVRLAHSLDAGAPVERPQFVADRYAAGDPPAEGPSLSVEFPEGVVSGEAVTVTGTTDGSELVVKTTAGTVHRTLDGPEFSVEVPIDDGPNTVTVVAVGGDDRPPVTEAPTTVRRGSVTGFVTGEEVATFDDPAGDDAGPGSYTYPTGAVYEDGVFDVTSFEIYETDEDYQFVYRLAGPVTNPWGGNPISLQSLQVYLRNPDREGGTTAARTGVHATFEDPYHYRVFAEGFVQPRVEAADGAPVTREVGLTAAPPASAIRVDVPKSALDADIRDMAVSPLLLGQDGFSEGRVRPVMATNGENVFGGGTDGTQDPNVVDVVVPDDTTQAAALSYSGTDLATIPFLSL
jgi:glucan 1,4-alpha-glucosidase